MDFRLEQLAQDRAREMEQFAARRRIGHHLNAIRRARLDHERATRRLDEINAAYG